jgi:hypothetical protein
MTSIQVATHVLIVVLMSTGCVNLQVAPVTAASNVPLKGVTYNLPFTQFELTVSRTLKECSSTSGKLDLSYETTVTVVSVASQPDSSQEYQLDLQSLSSFWKTSDLKITFYPGGMLQLVNASASDQTAQIIQNVASGLGTIAVKIATSGLGAAQGTTPECKPDVLDALAKHKPTPGQSLSPIDEALQATTDQLAKDTAVLKSWAAVSVAMGTRLDSATQKHIADAVTQVNIDTAQQVVAQKAVTSYQKLLTVTQTFRWPVTGALDMLSGHPPAANSLYQQVTLPGGTAAFTKWVANFSPADNYFISGLRLERLPGADILPPTSDITGSSGIRYRVPGRGRLIICQSKPATNTNIYEALDPHIPACSDPVGLPKTLPPTTAAVWEGMVPQLGRIQYLPYKNGPFQNNTLSATFNQDGTLASAEYSVPTSAGVTASGALNSVATTAGQTAKSIVTAPTTKLTAELTQVQTQNNLLSAQGTATTAEQTALASANTTLLNALVAQANARAALQKAATNATSP